MAPIDQHGGVPEHMELTLRDEDNKVIHSLYILDLTIYDELR